MGVGGEGLRSLVVFVVVAIVLPAGDEGDVAGLGGGCGGLVGVRVLTVPFTFCVEAPGG